MAWNARYLDDYADGPAILKVGQDITFLQEAQERALQAERLAAIGEVVAGLAHESRNALQRSQACLEMLALAVRDRPEALDLINRIQKAQDHLHSLYEDVRSYAAPIKLDKHPCELARSGARPGVIWNRPARGSRPCFARWSTASICAAWRTRSASSRSSIISWTTHWRLARLPWSSKCAAEEVRAPRSACDPHRGPR